jgi:nucleoside-diphosphate-sugar epimerase
MNTTELHVIFGTGPLGQSVARELVKRGKRTHMINRSGARPEGVNESVQVIRADIYHPDEVKRITRDAAVVYQCAQPAYTEWPQKFPPLIKSILAGMTGGDAKLVMGDNLYMYGPVDGPIHEGLPMTAQTRKGRVRAQIAEELIEAHQNRKVHVTIGRGSDFFGPGVLGSMVGETVFGALAQGKAANVMGNIDLPHTYTFINDFGKALVVLGEHDEALGQAWHIPNASAITTRQFVQSASEALGVKPKMMVAGSIMTRLIGLFVPEVREMVELEYEVIRPYVVDDSKFKQAFGDHSTPLQEAIQETAGWFKAHSPA